MKLLTCCRPQIQLLLAGLLGCVPHHAGAFQYSETHVPVGNALVLDDERHHCAVCLFVALHELGV